MEKKKRKIAIFTDAHGLLEPVKAALEDMRRRDVTEIYSLGDNINIGPNPKEVMDILEEYSVISLAGNACEYLRFGTEPFPYFNKMKQESLNWTISKLDSHHKGIINLFPRSIELLVGGKKLALCHFANDVRFDFMENSTWTYQSKIKNGEIGYKQFLYTNSEIQFQNIEFILKKYGVNSPMMKGYLSAKDDPLFAGKRVDYFDAIIQGHVHFKIYESDGSRDYYTIRAVGIGYKDDPIDTASYILLNEKEDGYDYEEVLVKYDREKMEYSILNSDSPNIEVYKYVCLDRHL